MSTNIAFVNTILNNQIAGYENTLACIDKNETAFPFDNFTYEEVVAEKIAALQEFKASLINFIAEHNKSMEKKSGKN